VYDHDLDDVEDLGREEFILRQWESVRACVINGPDRRLEGADAQVVVRGMAGVLADVRAVLAEITDLEPGLRASLLEQHARLLSVVHSQALEEDYG
jgi:hypothetical protein